MDDFFATRLKKIGILSFGVKVLSVPTEIIFSLLITSVVTAATNGAVKQVLSGALLLLSANVCFRVISSVGTYFFNLLSAKTLHSCRMLFLRRFF